MCFLFHGLNTRTTFGTAAHNSLENQITLALAKLKPFPQVRIEAEAFFFKPDSNGNSRPAGRRKRGSIGIDVLVFYKDKAVLGLDLKTGRGGSSARNKKLKKRIGTDIIEIQLEFFDN